MKKHILSLWLLLSSVPVAFIGTGCNSDTTAPGEQSQVTMVSSIENPSVSGIIPQKKYSIAAGGAACDSIQVTSARFLFSTVKMHLAASDTLADGTLKAGAFVATFSPNNRQIIASGSVTPGTYDRYKFEMHQYNPSIDLGGLISVDFTTPEHYTVIIEGNVYNDGIAYPFSYSSRVIANEEVQFYPQTFESGKTYHVAMDFVPAIAFSWDGYTVDPRDPNNADVIDAGLKASFQSYAALSNQ